MHGRVYRPTSLPCLQTKPLWPRFFKVPPKQLTELIGLRGSRKWNFARQVNLSCGGQCLSFRCCSPSRATSNRMSGQLVLNDRFISPVVVCSERHLSTQFCPQPENPFLCVSTHTWCFGTGSIPTAPLQRADRNYADREERIVRLPPLAPTTQLINHDSHWFDAGGSGQCGRRSSDQQWKPGSTGHLSPSAVTTTTANRQSGQCRPPVSRKRGIKPLSVDPEPKRLVVATTATTPAHEPGQDNSNKTCTRKGTHVSQRVSFADPDSLDSHSSKRPIRATSEPAKSVQLTATRNVPSVKSTSPLEANLPAQTQPVQKESEMTASTTYLPGLANYSSLDADSLANLDYIPTMKVSIVRTDTPDVLHTNTHSATDCPLLSVVVLVLWRPQGDPSRRPNQVEWRGSLCCA